jgi:hypothetical protein
MTRNTHIADLRHPDYRWLNGEWEEWRDTYRGGQDYLELYLTKFSDRETDTEFAARKECTPIPTFAKAAIQDIRNSIFQRLVEVSRIGGTTRYQRAVAGEDAGVDRTGSSMDSFMGIDVLTEILVMGSAGIFVDAPNIEPATMADVTQAPYLYSYRREDILNWVLDDQAEDGTFKAVLLRDYAVESHLDHELGISMPAGRQTRKRLVWKADDGQVRCRFYDPDNKVIFVPGADPATGNIELGIGVVPFIWPNIGDSLLADVASYQKALLNLVSGDVNWALRSNVPFLTIQEDMRTSGSHLREAAESAEPGGQSAKTREEQIGGGKGRYYDLATDRPDYIAPPTAPLEASMKLQEKLEDDIRKLVNLAVTNKAGSRTESAEAKKLSSQGLEAGLSYIGTVLQQAEQAIARYWAMYENVNRPQIAKVTYPSRYILKEDAERLEEAEKMMDIKDRMPGTKAKKTLNKMILEVLLSGRESVSNVNTLMAEVDSADYVTSGSEETLAAQAAGLVDDKTAAEALGYDPNKIEQARKDNAKKLEMVQRAQTSANTDPNADKVDRPAARGLPGDPDPDSAKKEKEEAKEE